MSTQPHTVRPQHDKDGNATEQAGRKAKDKVENLREKASETKERIDEKLPPELTEKVKQIMADARRHPVQAALMGLGALSIVRRLLQRKQR